ncbi:MAG: MaoC family dehydratase [Ktedonobacterales bacterium]
MQFGRYFEDFEVGDVYRHWPGRTISESDDTLFCMLTMNHNPLHIDANYAAGTQFGQRLVVGALVFSIALGMSVPDVSGRAIANLEFDTVRHSGPTFHGDTIYAQTRVLEKRASSSKPDRGVVKVETRAFNQHGQEVLYFRRAVMVPLRGHATSASRQQEDDWPVATPPGGADDHTPTRESL